MSGHYYSSQLYPFQDKILSILGNAKTKFYLTGGTVVGRFILSHRYSDDLDFFLNQDVGFNDEIDRVVSELEVHYKDIHIPVRQDSFARIIVKEDSIELKIEFVNDVGFRVGSSENLESGLLIDTWENILSNKLTALQREAPKDYVDILFLSLKFSFNWEEMINHAKKEDAWINEIEISKFLMNFEIAKLEEVKFVEGLDRSSIGQDFFKTLARESLHGFDNSLAGKTL